MDTGTHFVEFYVLVNRNSIIDDKVIQRIKLISNYLRCVAANEDDLEARTNLAYNSILVGRPRLCSCNGSSTSWAVRCSSWSVMCCVDYIVEKRNMISKSDCFLILQNYQMRILQDYLLGVNHCLEEGS